MAHLWDRPHSALQHKQESLAAVLGDSVYWKRWGPVENRVITVLEVLVLSYTKKTIEEELLGYTSND